MIGKKNKIYKLRTSLWPLLQIKIKAKECEQIMSSNIIRGGKIIGNH